MKTLNKILLCLLSMLINYDFLIGMDTPLKPTSANSHQSEHQVRSDQKRNRDCLERINNNLKRDEIGDYQFLGEQDLENFEKDFKYMKDDTPLKSKKSTAVKYMQSLQAKASKDNELNSVAQNNQIFQVYDSPVKSKLVSTLTDTLSSPEIRNYSVVDIDHVMKINPEYSDNSKDRTKLTKIKGGHSFEKYLDEKLIIQGDLLLIASDGKTIGFKFPAEIDKTLYLGLTEKIVLDNLKLGVTIAKYSHDKRLKVSLINKSRYVGSYQDSKNPCLYSTIFPVFVVNEKNKNESGDIYLGKFARLNSIIISGGTLDLREEKNLFISSSDFRKAVMNREQFRSDVEGILFANITNELNTIFKNDLIALGLAVFPVSIYGIIDNREIQ